MATILEMGYKKNRMGRAMNVDGPDEMFLFVQIHLYINTNGANMEMLNDAPGLILA